MRGWKDGSSSLEPLTRPRSQRQVKRPASAVVACGAGVVSQAPTSALSAARSRVHPAASRSIRKFIARAAAWPSTRPASKICRTAA